jgi:hypothetical protein
LDRTLLRESPIVRRVRVVEPNVRYRDDRKPTRPKNAREFPDGDPGIGAVFENLRTKNEVETIIFDARILNRANVVRIRVCRQV